MNASICVYGDDMCYLLMERWVVWYLSMYVLVGIHLEVTPFIARATRGFPLLFRHQLQRSGIRQHDLVDALSSSSSSYASSPFASCFSSPTNTTTTSTASSSSSSIGGLLGSLASHLASSGSLRNPGGNMNSTSSLSPFYPAIASSFSSSPYSSVCTAGSPKGGEGGRKQLTYTDMSCRKSAPPRHAAKTSTDKTSNDEGAASSQHPQGNSGEGGVLGDKEKERGGGGGSSGELDWTRVDLFAWDLLAENGMVGEPVSRRSRHPLY